MLNMYFSYFKLTFKLQFCNITDCDSSNSSSSFWGLLFIFVITFLNMYVSIRKLNQIIEENLNRIIYGQTLLYFLLVSRVITLFTILFFNTQRKHCFMGVLNILNFYRLPQSYKKCYVYKKLLFQLGILFVIHGLACIFIIMFVKDTNIIFKIINISMYNYEIILAIVTTTYFIIIFNMLNIHLTEISRKLKKGYLSSRLNIYHEQVCHSAQQIMEFIKYQILVIIVHNLLDCLVMANALYNRYIFNDDSHVSYVVLYKLVMHGSKVYVLIDVSNGWTKQVSIIKE